MSCDHNYFQPLCDHAATLFPPCTVTTEMDHTRELLCFPNKRHRLIRYCCPSLALYMCADRWSSLKETLLWNINRHGLGGVLQILRWHKLKHSNEMVGKWEREREHFLSSVTISATAFLFVPIQLIKNSTLSRIHTEMLIASEILIAMAS